MQTRLRISESEIDIDDVMSDLQESDLRSVASNYSVKKEEKPSPAVNKKPTQQSKL